jgi:hypothetical protein
MWKSSFGFVKIPLPSECAAQKDTEKKRKKGTKKEREAANKRCKISSIDIIK